MKKIISLILLILLSFSLISCDYKEEEEKQPEFTPKRLVIQTKKTVTNEEFLTELARALQSRWEVEINSTDTEYETNKIAVGKEYAIVEKYIEYEFEDSNLGSLYSHYFSSINMQRNAYDLTFNDYYNELWDIGYKPYVSYLGEFETVFNISSYIDSSYKDYFINIIKDKINYIDK